MSYINDPLAAIYNERQWRMSKVSPLYNLQSGAVKQKQYASKVRQALVTTAASNSSITYTVQFERQPHLKYSQDDPDGVMITVLSSQEQSQKVVYVCILLTWGVHVKLPDVVHLPYMLERGEQKLGAAVRATLEQMFDCSIFQFSFTQHQLLLFGFTFVQVVVARASDPFTLGYSMSQADHRNQLDVKLEFGDVHTIWNRVIEEANTSTEQVNLAYQILQNQIFYTMKLDVTVLDLNRVSVTTAEAKSDGTVRMPTPDVVNCVFVILNEITRAQYGVGG